MVLSSSEWMRRAAARTDKAAARNRCEEGCGTMDQTPDHRSETAGPDRSKRSVLRVIMYRSKKIIGRRMPESGAFKVPATEVFGSIRTSKAIKYGRVAISASLIFQRSLTAIPDPKKCEPLAGPHFLPIQPINVPSSADGPRVRKSPASVFPERRCPRAPQRLERRAAGCPRWHSVRPACCRCPR